MGSSFAARELHVTYPRPDDAAKYPEVFGCPVSFGQPDNRIVFDATWLDGTPRLGNEITYATVVGLCDHLMDELKLGAGVAGKVRRVLLTNLMRPLNFAQIAHDVNMGERTLRRKLREEGTSFRELVDQLRMDMAIKYLRDTDLTVEAISESLGFSDAANFRQAGVPPLDQRGTASLQEYFRQSRDAGLIGRTIGRMAPVVWPDPTVSRTARPSTPDCDPDS